MSATQVIEEISNLPPAEQEEVFSFLAQKIIARRDSKIESHLGKKLSFDEACEWYFVRIAIC